MTQLPALQDLLPLLPELVLACGAMLMLMIGAAVGERSSAVVNGWCVIILAIAAAALLWLPRGPHVMFGGSFVVDDYARFLKILTLIGSGGALILSLDYLTFEKQQKFEYGALFLLATLGMLMLISASDLIALYLGLELMSLPLYVIAGVEPRERTVDGSGAQIFRAGRALVRNAALRRFADLRVYGHHQLCRHCQGNAKRREHWADLRTGVPVRRLLFQDFRCTVPHVDAGRLRRRAHARYGVLRRPHPRSPPSPSSHARLWSPFQALPNSGSRSSYSFRSPQWSWEPLPRSANETSNA
jgi:hypothetical protein